MAFFSSTDIRRPPLTYVICLFLSLFEGVSVTSTPPSACCRTGPSSASVNTTPLARIASAAGRASKPNPGKLVPTCQRPTGPPTAVRIRNMAGPQPVNKIDGMRDEITLQEKSFEVHVWTMAELRRPHHNWEYYFMFLPRERDAWANLPLCFHIRLWAITQIHVINPVELIFPDTPDLFFTFTFANLSQFCWIEIRGSC